MLAKKVINSLGTQEADDQEMITQAKTQILENKIMKPEGRRWKKEHFGKFETIYSVALYKINSFHTTPTIFSKTVPTHTKKYNSKPQLLHPKGTAILSKCHGSLVAPHCHEVLQVAPSRQRCRTPGSPSAVRSLRGSALLRLCSIPFTHSL